MVTNYRQEPAVQITSSNNFDVETFLNASVQLGKEFLYCGGPVSRLEDQLTRAGMQFEIETSVQATPSGLIISAHRVSENKTYSRMCRINDSTIDLGRLRSVDHLLGNLADGKLTPERALIRFQRIQSLHKKRTPTIHFLCLFGIGVSAALLTGASPFLSLFGGVFTVGIDLTLKFFVVMVGINKVFSDFLSCFLALTLSKLCAYYINIPAGVLSIGTLAFIVPGLLMTTAISEIVEQNYISGTIRFIKSLYTFLAMGLAYFFASELQIDPLWRITEEMAYKGTFPYETILLKIVAAMGITLSVSIEFGAHKKSILRTLFCGFVGATTFFLLEQSLNAVVSSFLAAFVIGLLSFKLGRRFRHPSQIYSVPSIMSLVPGMMAFSSFSSESSFFIKALMTSLAIVFGLAAGRMPSKHS